ncbi:hypothetical protein GFK82_00034 [Candidatus Steffania adelgidicola]|nr:hypothetical protein GFK82_00034 [Candidatus Steffania adelgidicola]
MDIFQPNYVLGMDNILLPSTIFIAGICYVDHFNIYEVNIPIIPFPKYGEYLLQSPIPRDWRLYCHLIYMSTMIWYVDFVYLLIKIQRFLLRVVANI